MGKFKNFSDYIYSLSLSDLVRALSFHPVIINFIDNYIRNNDRLVANQDLPTPFYNSDRRKEQDHVADYCQDIDTVNDADNDDLRSYVIAEIEDDSELYSTIQSNYFDMMVT